MDQSTWNTTNNRFLDLNGNVYTTNYSEFDPYVLLNMQQEDLSLQMDQSTSNNTNNHSQDATAGNVYTQNCSEFDPYVFLNMKQEDLSLQMDQSTSNNTYNHSQDATAGNVFTQNCSEFDPYVLLNMKKEVLSDDEEPEEGSENNMHIFDDEYFHDLEMAIISKEMEEMDLDEVMQLPPGQILCSVLDFN